MKTAYMPAVVRPLWWLKPNWFVQGDEAEYLMLDQSRLESGPIAKRLCSSSLGPDPRQTRRLNLP